MIPLKKKKFTNYVAKYAFLILSLKVIQQYHAEYLKKHVLSYCVSCICYNLQQPVLECACICYNATGSKVAEFLLFC